MKLISAFVGFSLSVLVLGVVQTVSAQTPKGVDNVSLGLRHFEDKQYSEAARLLGPAAANGDGVAQYFMGRLLQDGLGVSKDRIKAYVFFNLSAAKVNPRQADARKERDRLATLLSAEDLESAQDLATRGVEGVPDGSIGVSPEDRVVCSSVFAVADLVLAMYPPIASGPSTSEGTPFRDPSISLGTETLRGFFNVIDEKKLYLTFFAEKISPEIVGRLFAECASIAPAPWQARWEGRSQALTLSNGKAAVAFVVSEERKRRLIEGRWIQSWALAVYAEAGQ